MVTPNDCLTKYGTPGSAKANSFMTIWDVPTELEIGVIPKRLYCNKDIVLPLTKAFINLIKSGCVKELKTFDGCYNIRPQRGTKATPSLHSWGIAIDVNAAWNQLGKEPVLSLSFINCFTEAGFDWGGNWKRKDGMHFQLSKI